MSSRHRDWFLQGLTGTGRKRQVALSNVLCKEMVIRMSDFSCIRVLLSSHAACPQVCDFGLSRVLSAGRTHVSTRPYGTPTHMVRATGHQPLASNSHVPLLPASQSRSAGAQG